MLKYFMLVFMIIYPFNVSFSEWIYNGEIAKFRIGNNENDINYFDDDSSGLIKTEIAVNSNGYILLSDRIGKKIYFLNSTGEVVNIVKNASIGYENLWPTGIMALYGGSFSVAYDKYIYFYNENGYVYKNIDIGMRFLPVYSTLDDTILIVSDNNRSYIIDVNGSINSTTDSIGNYINISGKYLNNKKHEYHIHINNKEYIFDINDASISFYRNYKSGELLVYSSSSRTVYRIDKFGNLIGSLLLPNQDFSVDTNIDQYAANEIINNNITAFGHAYLGLDGNVYSWKQADDKFSILRWTWADSPSAHVSEPAAPSNP